MITVFRKDLTMKELSWMAGRIRRKNVIRAELAVDSTNGFWLVLHLRNSSRLNYEQMKLVKQGRAQ